MHNKICFIDRRTGNNGYLTETTSLLFFFSLEIVCASIYIVTVANNTQENPKHIGLFLMKVLSSLIQCESHSCKT